MARIGGRTRIAMISEHASPLAVLGSEDAGGQNVYVAEVSRHLAGLGYDVDVFTRRDKPELADVVQWMPNVRVVHLTVGPQGLLKKDQMWRYMPQFRDGILDWIRGRPFPDDRGRSYDLIHANFWMSGWVGCEIKNTLGAPLVEIFHALGVVKRLHQREADSSPAERFEVEQRIIATADRIIAQCPAEVHELAKYYSASTKHVRVVPSAVNAELFVPVERREARRLVGIPDEGKLVVYVGRMLPRKGVDNLVRAVAMLAARETDPVRLMLVGGETMEPDPVATPEIGRLMALAADLGILDRTAFVGKRQQKLLKYYYSAGDAVVTTPWYEPYGLTPLEGMACGRPVIGSSVGGIQFTVADGETGFLVPPNDPAALADRLQKLLENAGLRAAMGAAARLRVESTFTWRKVAENTASVYEELLAKPTARARGISRVIDDGR